VVYVLKVVVYVFTDVHNCVQGLVYVFTDVHNCVQGLVYVLRDVYNVFKDWYMCSR
jgi:hypothetical protein